MCSILGIVKDRCRPISHLAGPDKQNIHDYDLGADPRTETPIFYHLQGTLSNQIARYELARLGRALENHGKGAPGFRNKAAPRQPAEVRARHPEYGPGIRAVPRERLQLRVPAPAARRSSGRASGGT